MLAMFPRVASRGWPVLAQDIASGISRKGWFVTPAVSVLVVFLGPTSLSGSLLLFYFYLSGPTPDDRMFCRTLTRLNVIF